VKRTPINPSSWWINLGFDQGELVEGHRRVLSCSGQDAMDAKGNRQHPGDIAAQLELALDNWEAVLATVDMTFGNVVRIQNRQQPFRGQSLCDQRLGVAQLPAQFLVMVEATAVD
jgi:Endoribonuclease L-PSP